jgi:Mg-chelatase subunit ChlI
LSCCYRGTQIVFRNLVVMGANPKGGTGKTTVARAITGVLPRNATTLVLL